MKALLIGLGVIVLIVGGSLLVSRNQLVAEREAINLAFAQVDVVLQRRLDLIPNLVETVKGFAKQEQSVIDSVTNARAAMMGARSNAEKIAGSQQLDSAIGRLFVMVEAYPQLKSDQNFLRLQDELAGTEGRISQERRRYNEAVQRYNTNIALFPKNIAASIFGFQREDSYITADPAAKQAPTVKF